MKSGERIKDFRETKGITQGDFAGALGISQGYLAQIEIGIREPSREFLKKIYRVYGLSADHVLHGKEVSPQPEKSGIPKEIESKEIELHDLLALEPRIPYRVITPEEKKLIDSMLEILDSDDEDTIDALRGNIQAFVKLVRFEKNKDKGGNRHEE